MTVLIALAIGLAGGYGIFRFAGSGSDAALAAAQQAADRMNAENDRLKDQLEAAQKALAEAKAAASTAPGQDSTALRDQIDAQAAQIETLTKERDALRDSAEAGDSRIAAERDGLAQQVKDLNAEIERLSADKAAGEDAVAALQSQLEKTKAELEATKQSLAELAERSATDDTPADTKAATQTGDAASAGARDPQAVEDAMRDAPGLDTLSAADRQSLKDALVNGECVTTALEAVFDDVPIVALRNLIRDLNSGC